MTKGESSSILAVGGFAPNARWNIYPADSDYRCCIDLERWRWLDRMKRLTCQLGCYGENCNDEGGSAPRPRAVPVVDRSEIVPDKPRKGLLGPSAVALNEQRAAIPLQILVGCRWTTNPRGKDPSSFAIPSHRRRLAHMALVRGRESATYSGLQRRK